ncbi:MBOAT family O-acyltransferase [Phaeospirillum tilakii]|uniref:Probable alginate O-acetylase AlgI n=1 Tax=Phaeospirillum tilakii TaxID=741673 RepID=A0ABW5CGC9_9PROT
MLFNTFEYLFFFLTVLTISWLTSPCRPLRLWVILIASFWFYFSNNHWQIALLLLTTTIDWALCLRMAVETNERRRKLLLSVSLISNLGLLFYFKYFNFFIGSIVEGLASIGWKLNWVEAQIMLPVGISFFTFEALSYTIDVYRRQIPAERQWSRLAFLVSFFPHLIAGPIIRAADFFPQINKKPTLSLHDFELALYLIFVGIFKKLVLADTLAIYADAAFDAPHSVDSLVAWLGVYAFALQIFFDFSGYTDIARGCGKLLGYELPENFRRPYVAVSITDFWRRWHLTLSSWLRDYLYISLGGNRMKTKWGVYRNLMLTMLLGGAWHGAAWHFVLWGGLHGALLCIERAIPGGTGRPGLLRSLLVFHLVALIWIPFRAKDLPSAEALLVQMVSGGIGPAYTYGMVIAALIIAASWGWQYLTERVDLRTHYLALPIPVKALTYSLIALTVFVTTAGTPKTFIYFQF